MYNLHQTIRSAYNLHQTTQNLVNCLTGVVAVHTAIRIIRVRAWFAHGSRMGNFIDASHQRDIAFHVEGGRPYSGTIPMG